MSNPSPKSSHSNKKPSRLLSIRLSSEERSKLEKHAAGIPLSTYVKSRVFDETKAHRQTRNKAPVKDHQALAQVLACLGASGLAQNVSVLAKAFETDSYNTDNETCDAIKKAKQDIHTIKELLMHALGVMS